MADKTKVKASLKPMVKVRASLTSKWGKKTLPGSADVKGGARVTSASRLSKIRRPM